MLHTYLFGPGVLRFPVPNALKERGFGGRGGGLGSVGRYGRRMGAEYLPK